MKALRYLLIVMMLSVASLAFATAQSLAQQPEAQMQSTSILQGSGSQLPSAAVSGVSTTYEPTATPNSNAHRAKNGRPGDWDDPYKDPLGDAAWLLILAAAVYGVYRRKRSRSVSGSL